MLIHKLMGAKVKVPSYTYNDFASNTANLTTYTFSGVSIGAASSDRLVVVVIGTGYGTGNASNQKISSVTIGGVSAIIATQSQDYSTTANGFGSTAIAYAVVSSGTTADVVVVNQIEAVRCVCASYSLYGLRNTAPEDTDGFVGSTSDSTNTNTNTDTVNTSVGSIVISGAQSTSPTTGSDYNWTGVDEDYDETVESARRYSGGSVQSVSSGALNVTAARTSVSPNFFSMATASWR